MQSYIFDFEKSPTFFRKWNKEFDVEDIGTNCFYIYIVNDVCENNIEDCLNSDGQLIYDDTNVLKQQCVLKYEEENENAHISLDGDVTIPVEGSFKMKGTFLVADSGYVIGYSINTYALNVISSIIFEDGLKFFSLVDGDLSGE